MPIRFRIRTIIRLTPTSLPPLSKVRCCRPKKFGRLPEGLLPICTSPPKTALSLKKHYILASLVKGRWLDGKAQALILLLSVCDTPTFFIYQTFLPSRRRDCFTPTNLSIPHNHCERTIIPCPTPCSCLPCQREVA